MKTLRRAVVALAAAMMPIGIACADAQQVPNGRGGQSYERALLDLFVEKGIVTREELEKLENALQADQRSRSEQQAASALSTDEVAQTAADVVKAQLAKLPRVYGRLQPRHTYIPKADDNLEGTNNFNFRRARIGFFGKATDDIFYNVLLQADSPDNNAELRFAYIGYTKFESTVGQILFGQQYVPVHVNSSSGLIGVDRTFAQNINPARDRGVKIQRGTLTAAKAGKGAFGDRLHWGFGAFNGTEAVAGNDNNDLTWGAMLSLTPRGPLSGDEYNIDFSPFRYGLGFSSGVSRESRTLDLRGQTASAGRMVWWSPNLEVEWNGWYGFAQYAQRFIREEDGILLMRADGGVSEELVSRALSTGVSRVFKSPRNGEFIGIGFQYQNVDNEIPARERLFGPFEATDPGSIFSVGDVYAATVTYIFRPRVRFQVEYQIYDEKGRTIDNNALITQFSVDF